MKNATEKNAMNKKLEKLSTVTKHICDDEDVRELAKDETMKLEITVTISTDEPDEGTGTQKKETVTAVLEGNNKRKTRATNLIIFVIGENELEARQKD